MPDADTPTRAHLMTPHVPGAIAIIQVRGPAAVHAVTRLSQRDHWTLGRLHRVNFADIDQGVAVRLAHDLFQLMPHAGTRVVQTILQSLTEHGITLDAQQPPATDLYPEADAPIDADMLAAIARAASPLAIDLLAAQPDLWRHALRHPDTLDLPAITRRTATLDQLITPPTIVVVGAANVGKSTLTNRLLGRAASVVADLPGTTRDWVAGLAELNLNPDKPDPQQALAVRWLDTPGLRDSDDPIEQRAIDIARHVIADAHLIIAMRDSDHPFPDPASLPRTPDLYLLNKADLTAPTPQGDGHCPTAPLPISAATGQNLPRLERTVLHALGLTDLHHRPALWAFSPTLIRATRTTLDTPTLTTYLTPTPA